MKLLYMKTWNAYYEMIHAYPWTEFDMFSVETVNQDSPAKRMA
jgi:hypothetical protein